MAALGSRMIVIDIGDIHISMSRMRTFARRYILAHSYGTCNGFLCDGCFPNKFVINLVHHRSCSCDGGEPQEAAAASCSENDDCS